MGVDRQPQSPSTEVLVVVGTRPEAIKLLPLVRALQEHPLLTPVVVSTGQHTGIVEGIFESGGCEVTATLGVGRPGLTLNELTAAVVSGLERFLVELYGRASADGHAGAPLFAVVHGDTSSAAAAALAAFHARIPVVHVEAGLRTFDTRSPFPEELNRQLIGRIAAFHLAPTRSNLENLVREGVDVGRILVTGNTGIDALLWAAQREVPYGRPELDWLEHDVTTRVVTVTAHRRENWGQGIADITTGVRRLALSHPRVRFVVPVHPNPVVAGAVREGLTGLPNVTLTAPMDYLPFARLLARSHLVVTDSGGIQEEAPALDVPVLVTRTTTERGEGLDAGTLELVGTDPDRIVAAATRLLDDDAAHAAMAARPNPYGDGRAAQRIVAALDALAFDLAAPAEYGPGFSRAEVLGHAGVDATPRVRPSLPAPAGSAA